MKLLILRPEPGASETAARALDMGLDPVVAPLFEIRGVDPGPIEPAGYQALLLTSANGARHAPPGLTGLPCFTVGERTAAAARSAGFADIRIGPGDGAAAMAMIAASGLERVLHLCGRDHLPMVQAGVSVEGRVVYAAEPTAETSFEGPAVAMIHSARAAIRFARLVADKSSVAVATISAAAADSAGEGWAAKAVAAEPRDHALLELAAKLCNHGDDVVRNGNGL
ncbi:MAG TPA: uroporphyrinogen-III synthase [Allosphingosinicella sp.]